MPDPQRPPITDSPWFWVYLFSMAAAVALFVMDGKYNHRQAHIEDEYRFGTRTLAKPSADASPATVSSPQFPEKGTASEAAPLTGGPQPATHELMISLSPLRVIAIVVAMISCVAIQWRWIKQRTYKA